MSRPPVASSLFNKRRVLLFNLNVWMMVFLACRPLSLLCYFCLAAVKASTSKTTFPFDERQSYDLSQ